jgi:hypothetical protein|tara:strand:- start:1321 stop:1797 length:477 start_codon:yes stop_codon:yes gene_type:complete
MAKRKKRPQQQNVDHGPVEIKKHGIFEKEDTIIAGVKRLRNRTVDPIETLWHRNLINQKQYDASNRFAFVYRKAQLTEVYATVKFGVIKGVPSLEAQETIMKARKEIKCVLNFVGYPLASLLEHTVGNAHKPATWNNGKGNIDALRLAIDGLVCYYKL